MPAPQWLLWTLSCLSTLWAVLKISHQFGWGVMGILYRFRGCWQSWTKACCRLCRICYSCVALR